MNKVIKYIVGTLIALACMICIVLSFSQGKKDREKIVLQRIVVENTNEEGKRFMSESDVTKHLQLHFGKLIGAELDSIQLHKIEKSLSQNSAILKSEAYTTLDGTLHIQIKERKARVRFQGEQGGFYADENRILFPLQPNYTAWVPVVDGNFPIRLGKKMSKEDKKWMDGLFAMLSYMQASNQWKDRCNQIHVQQNGEICLYFEGLDERFIFGDFQQLENKFEKIEKYVSTIREEADKKYKSVNVQFKGQIICK